MQLTILSVLHKSNGSLFSLLSNYIFISVSPKCIFVSSLKHLEFSALSYLVADKEGIVFQDQKQH